MRILTFFINLITVALVIFAAVFNFFDTEATKLLTEQLSFGQINIFFLYAEMANDKFRALPYLPTLFSIWIGGTLLLFSFNFTILSSKAGKIRFGILTFLGIALLALTVMLFKFNTFTVADFKDLQASAWFTTDEIEKAFALAISGVSSGLLKATLLTGVAAILATTFNGLNFIKKLR